MTILAKKKRNKEIKELFLSGVPVKDICDKFDLSQLDYILRSQGVVPKEVYKKLQRFCLVHPDRLSVNTMQRCTECQKVVLRARTSYMRSTTRKRRKVKEKQVFVPRELTDGERKIRDRYRNMKTNGGGRIWHIDVEVNVKPRGIF